MGEIQRAFASGEVSPTLYGRADVDRWSSALKTCRNWIVEPEGGVTVRQGFELKAVVPRQFGKPEEDIRIIPFEYGPSDSYVQVHSSAGGIAAIRDGVLLRGGATRSATLNMAVTPMTLTSVSAFVFYTTGDTIEMLSGTLSGNTYTVTVVSNDVISLDGTTATAGSETATYGQLTSRKTAFGTLDQSVAPNLVTGYVGSMVTGDTIKSISGTTTGTVYTITVTGSNTFTLDGTVATAGVSDLQYLVPNETEQPVARWVFDRHAAASDARFVQSGDVQYFAFGDGSAAPYKFTRDTSLSTGTLDMATLSFAGETIFGYPDIHTVSTLTATSGGGAGTEQVRYRVTVSTKDGVESAVLRNTRVSSSSISGTNTYTITMAAPHGLITNDQIIIDLALDDNNGVSVYKPGDIARVVVTGANTFTIPGNGTSASTGTLYYYRFTASVGSVLTPSSSAAMTITWSAVNGAAFYNVFREFGRVYGYIGSTSDTTFVDRGIIPDTKDTPVTGISPFRGDVYSYFGNNPKAVGLFQQRLMFGGFTDDPERIVGSHTGNYVTYDPGAEDASGLDFGLAGRTVSGVKHMVEIAGRAVVLSNTSEWVIRGGTNGGITPTAINARTDSYYGCSDVVPAVVGTNLIYVQRGDRIVRDAQYDFGQEALASRDLTLWSKHLFKQGVKRITYQRSDQILWCLLKDGTLAALTYIPEQNIWGWHRHDIAGRVIHDICVVSESGQDRLYAAILGVGNVMVCRLPLRWESEVVDDHIGFDMALTYNGFYSGTTGTLTGGTDWTTDETLTLTASASTFVVGDVGKDFLLRLGDDDVQVTCTAYTSGTVVSVQPRTIVPVALRGVATSDWAVCASTFSGLDHLEGETVGIIADGGREPNAVVSGGAVALSRPFARVQVGIPITADIQTLDIEATQKDTSLGDFKHVTRVILRILNSRGLKAGLTESTLEEMYPEYTDVVNAAPALQSGVREVLMSATHEDSGSVLVRQDQGLPSTVLNARTVFNIGESR